MKVLTRGFTLIELLMVVVLIAIMLAIAVPSFSQFIANYRVTTAINDYLQGVNITRQEALKRGRYVDMAPADGVNWNSGWVIYVDNDRNYSYEATTDELIFRHDPLSSFINVSQASSPIGSYVGFDGTGYPRVHPPGGPLSGGISMKDTNAPAAESRTLCIAPLGRPRIFVGVPPTCAGG